MAIEIKTIKKQIDLFFGDTSRPPSETKDGLEELIDHVKMLIDTLKEDEED